jgi:hypothetical protein
MNKMLPKDHVRISEKAFMRLIGEPVPFVGRFAKEAHRKARRAERRQVRARKAEWLNS